MQSVYLTELYMQTKWKFQTVKPEKLEAASPPQYLQLLHIDATVAVVVVVKEGTPSPCGHTPGSKNKGQDQSHTRQFCLLQILLAGYHHLAAVQNVLLLVQTSNGLLVGLLLGL